MDNKMSLLSKTTVFSRETATYTDKRYKPGHGELNQDGERYPTQNWTNAEIATLKGPNWTFPTQSGLWLFALSLMIGISRIQKQLIRPGGLA